jgi:outer membrane immunogenic protein
LKKILLATAAFAAFGLVAPATAADLAARTYTKAPIVSPGTNWSGFYAGLMGGYGWSSKVSVDGATTNTSDIKGGFGGGTIGYNWQTPGSMWVFGLEADAAGADLKYAETGTVGGVAVTLTDKINSFGSVTGRVGVTAGAALFYAKGGYGWANNRFSLAVPGASFTETKFHSGWTVGAGAEYMFAQNWSAKAEYMYADYGNARYLTAFAPAGLNLGLATHTVKAGLNYHFN